MSGLCAGVNCPVPMQAQNLVEGRPRVAPPTPSSKSTHSHLDARQLGRSRSTRGRLRPNRPGTRACAHNPDQQSVKKGGWEESGREWEVLVGGDAPQGAPEGGKRGSAASPATAS